MTEKSMAAVRRYWGAANTHSASEMLDTLADDYVHHDSGLPVPDADRETHVQIIAGGMFTAFSDLHITLHDIMAEGDRVAVRWSFTGTHEVRCRATHRFQLRASASRCMQWLFIGSQATS